jgi:hypothetical protein
MASPPPRTYPTIRGPGSRVPISMRMPSMAIATMGPRRTALGEVDFTRAAMNPARMRSPGKGQVRCPATRTTMAMAVRRWPLMGTLGLCRKLPRTISEVAQRLPKTAALCQVSLNGCPPGPLPESLSPEGHSSSGPWGKRWDVVGMIFGGPPYLAIPHGSQRVTAVIGLPQPQEAPRDDSGTPGLGGTCPPEISEETLLPRRTSSPNTPSRLYLLRSLRLAWCKGFVGRAGASSDFPCVSIFLSPGAIMLAGCPAAHGFIRRRGRFP